MFHEEKDTLNMLGKFANIKEPKKEERKEEPKEAIRERIVYRDMGKIHIKPKEESFWRYFLPIIGLIIIVMMFNQNEKISNNPLLGQWRNKSTFGIIEIEFKKNTVSAFGYTSKVNYEIEKNKITVFDTENKIGTIYTVQDANTMYTDMLGFKTIYKRVE